MGGRINNSMKVFLIDKFIAWLTLLSGLSISFVAIYYSVAGLVAIFAAAAVPIIIMGVTLELSKLVATLWLKWNWTAAPRLIKTYLCIAVAVLMFITSMGIFGFLSKAHIDQTASSLDSVARVEQIDKEVARQNALIERAEQRLQRIETSGVGADANVQSQIDAEQARIDSAYQRIQPAIDEQQRIIDGKIKLFQDELARVDQELTTLQSYIDANDIRKAQAMVGTRVDGQFGPATAASFQRWQAAKAQERNAIIAKIESANTNPTVREARDEIQRLRLSVEKQIEQSNQLINRLRSQLGQADPAEIEKQLNEQRIIITTATAEVDSLTSQKYELEAETRKLEAEVGPIKFIADFIYGDRTDKNTLEEAVRWMILIIVIVFDPLAIVLLLASQHSFQWFRQVNENTKPEIESVKIEESPLPKSLETEYEIDQEEYVRDIDRFPYLRNFVHFKNTKPVETPIEEDEEFDNDVLETAHPSEKLAMQKWKAENPNDSLKHQKRLFREGVIDVLPWERYLEDDEAAQEALRWAEEQAVKKKEMIYWIERDGNQQIKKSKEQ
jgi:hypothetical protein